MLVTVWLARVAGVKLQGWPFLWIVLAEAAFRGLLLQWLFTAVGIVTFAGPVVRILFSLFYVGFGIVVAGLWLQQIRQHNALLESMFGEQERLFKIKFEAEHKILEANQRLIADIQRDLTDRVGKVGTASALESLAVLRDAIDHVVRPISQQLTYDSAPWNPDPVRPRRLKVSWSRVFAESFSIANIHPLAVTVAVNILIAPTVLEAVTIEKFWLLVAVVPLAQYLFLETYRWVARRQAATARRWVQTATVIMGFIVAGAISSLVGKALMGQDSPIQGAPVQNLVYTVVIGISVSMMSQALRAMSKVEVQLAETTAEAGWQITRIRQVHRELEQTLANKLHGKIQGTLAAAYLKLSRAITDDELANVPLTEYKVALLRNIDELERSTARANRFDEALAETKETWIDVCRIDFEIDSGLHDLIYADPLLCHALEDIVPELAFNAVKHGQATSIYFEFALTNERTLRLMASDNGRMNQPSSRVGVGSKLLDECCIRWTRESSPAGTVTTAVLPVQR